MRNYFTLDGVDCRTMGVYISGSGTESAPAHRYNVVQVPGRNGDLVVSDNAYENTTLTYPAFICDSINTNLADFRAFLMSRNGYVSLTDSYHPNERRQVLFTGPFEPDMTSKLDAAQFELEFSAKPQRWLLSGDTKITISSNAQENVINPTRFPARPVFYVYASGSFDFSWLDMNGTQPVIVRNTISILGVLHPPIIIDMESLFMYYVNQYGANVNCSNLVSMSSEQYSFPAGKTILVKNETNDKLEVAPRWWTL